jgi:hypothetical protein
MDKTISRHEEKVLSAAFGDEYKLISSNPGFNLYLKKSV